jgi:REP element-mobilizing transposase RayT
MSRPLRLEFAGAPYHVTARGNERRSIFVGYGDDDRVRFPTSSAAPVSASTGSVMPSA